MRVVPHPKLKRDYPGRRVRTTAPIQSGRFIVPAGSLAVIGSQNNKGSELTFDPCPCCGIQARVTAVPADDIEFVECNN